jgi:hypothetical protein
MQRSRQQHRQFIMVHSAYEDDLVDKAAAEAEVLLTTHGKGVVALVFNTFATRRAVSEHLGKDLPNYRIYSVDTFVKRDHKAVPLAAALVVGAPTYERLVQVDNRFARLGSDMQARVTYLAAAPAMVELRRNLARLDEMLGEAAANAQVKANELQVQERETAVALQRQKDREDAVERTKQSLRDMGGRFREVGMDDSRDPTKNAGAVAEMSREGLVRHHALADVGHQAQIGALEDLLNEIARDLGVKPGDFQALRSAILQTRLGRNAPELWAAWMTGIVDLMGMQALPRVGYMGPIHHAVRAMMQATKSDTSDRKVEMKEQAVLEAAAPTLALIDKAGDTLRKLFAEAADRADERRQQTAAGTDTPQGVVQGIEDLLARATALNGRDDLTDGEQNAMGIVAQNLETLQRTAKMVLPPTNLPVLR